MLLNQFIDHTLLKPTATPEEITQLCNEAIAHQFYAVCVNSGYVHLAVNLLKFEKVRVAATVGFPLGAMSADTKVYEAKKCIEEGADEIDMVMNIGFLKSGLIKSVREEISAVKKGIGTKVLKVILETCYLTDEEKTLACSIAEKAGADYVKTSTGFGTGGATLEDIQLMREAVSMKVKIKASGGIKTGKEAIEYIAHGVSRIGTSNGIQLIQTQ
ncbi:MAG TPA: deoxyribose-phosphate aldolase [Flavobacteriaceae bacterium]|nr:deoxyribose-phosphate aldolase [Flavobacteriaceae bacterium]HAT66267.1 deoxyribose-phosphate aldolase [Flavobacteriaceae bacterium]|tara:strand:- start:109161 stop:109805 length:645 start_codon:yes stop_codon:yes gene_type:complete